MARVAWLRFACGLALATACGLTAGDAKDKDKDKAEKPARPKVRAVDVDNFRKSKAPDVVEIVALHDEIAGYYAELTPLRNVAAGDDEREARKADRDIKGLESKIDRATRKLEKAVDKYTRPIEKVYEENKTKYDGYREKGDQLTEQGQEKKATSAYQMADRYTGKMEGAKRQLDSAQSMLYFDEIDGTADKGGDKPDKGGDKPDKGGDKPDKGDRRDKKPEKLDKER